MGFLDDVRILDVAYGWAGPIATQVLVDYGAQVVRVDRPGAVRSTVDLVRLRGRRSIVIDLAARDGQTLLERLVKDFDVLLTEPALDGKDPVEAGYAGLHEINPRLVYCRITGYGDEGPLARSPAHDHLVAARYGVHNQPGYREGPTFVTAPVPSLGAGLLAVQAIGAALYRREQTGKGQEVTTSLLAGALAFQPGIVSSSVEPLPVPAVTRRPQGAAPFYSIYECAGGRYLHFGCLTPAFQQRAMKALGIGEDLTSLGFGTPEATKNLGETIERITRRMLDEPYAAWAAKLEEADVPYAEAMWAQELFDDPQVAHEALLVDFDDPTAGRMTQIGASMEFGENEWRQPSPAPVPGNDTDAICREAGVNATEIDDLKRATVIA